MTLSRRGLLRVGAGLAAAGVGGAAGVLGLAATGNLGAVGGHLRREFRGAGPQALAPTIPAGQLTTGTFTSTLMRGRQIDYAISYPPGSATENAMPVVLALYGRGANFRSLFEANDLALPQYQAQAVAGGAAPFAIATVEGGPTSYWHARADGTDPQSMIADELLPILAARGLRTERIGLSGESMGGYGALLLAERLGAGSVAGVALFAPALFASYSASSPVAFDSVADYAAHDVFTGVPRLANVPIRIVCGRSDPFYSRVRQFVALPHQPPVETWYAEGGHDPAFWRTQCPAQLQFLAKHLST